MSAEACAVDKLAQNQELRRLLLKSVARTSDIACSMQPFHLAQAWARQLQAEYNRQAEHERELGWDPEPYLTKKLDVHIAQAQVSWICCQSLAWTD